MKIAYFDCFSGASGDMILGGLVDAGLSLERLKKDIARLNLNHYDLDAQRVTKQGISATQVFVIVGREHHRHHHRHLEQIKNIIKNSSLSEPVKQKSIIVFTRLAEAEAKVHHTSLEKIHFHEVGAMDAVIDVVGSIAGMAALGIEKIICSPLNTGSGTVECAHGTLPVPTPATAELIKAKPVYTSGIQKELLTPTGAALLTTLADDFGPMPAMTVEHIGYGAGQSELAIPNLLRIIIGQDADTTTAYDTEQVAVIETSIDDMNPQIYDHILKKLLTMEIMDAFLSPLQMKKNRPGTLITVICLPKMIQHVTDFLMAETTTIGLRWRMENRIKAHRCRKEIQTPYGIITIKISRSGSRILNVSPEYEECKRIALEKKIPLKLVLESAKAVAFNDYHY